MPLRVFIERLDYPAPGRALGVVDLAQIQHLALHDSATGASLGFYDVPVAMLFAILEAPVAFEIKSRVLDFDKSVF